MAAGVGLLLTLEFSHPHQIVRVAEPSRTVRALLAQDPRAETGQPHLLIMARSTVAPEIAALLQRGFMEVQENLSVDDLVIFHNSNTAGILAEVNADSHRPKERLNFFSE